MNLITEVQCKGGFRMHKKFITSINCKISTFKYSTDRAEQGWLIIQGS